jgi:type IV pilus assembly protein PilQ
VVLGDAANLVGVASTATSGVPTAQQTAPTESRPAPALAALPATMTVQNVEPEPLVLESAAPAPANVGLLPATAQEPSASMATPEQAMEKKFSGHPVSFDFKDGDIIDLFRLMSEISGLNIIVNPGVSGKVSLSLKDVPWDQALDLILKTNGLGYTLDGNVVRIAKLADLQKEEQDLRKLKDEKELSGDLETWQHRLSYLDPTALKPVVEKTVLSARGTMTPVTGAVFIVTDLPERVAAAKALIIDLDRPVAQVEIEARIVITTRNFTRQLGVQWGFLNRQIPQLGNTTDLAFPNAIVLNGQGVPGGGISADQGGLASDAGIGSGARGYMVNLPAAAFNTGIGVSMGNILGSFNLDAALTALESSGRGRIISTPRITTQDKVEAEIKQGVQIPYQTISNNTVTVAFKDAGLVLRVTPQVTSEGTVFMKVVVENSSPDFGNEVLGVPPINTQSAQTSVLVRDGATTVIGGIYQGTETTNRQNTPFLSQIPILGMLFKNKGQTSRNNELLIFITPRIVR